MSSRNAYLMRKYGITEHQYECMLEMQGGGCGICGYVPGEGKRRLAVDHDHKTGEVRGLLCYRCNRGLIWFKDKVNLYRKAAKYIELPPFSRLGLWMAHNKKGLKG